MTDSMWSGNRQKVKPPGSGGPGGLRSHTRVEAQREMQRA